MSSTEHYWEVEAFPANDRHLRAAAARLLVEEFRQDWPDAWPTLEAAESEVAQALEEDKVAFMVRDRATRTLLGWVGALPQYGGRAWELHPLVVGSSHRRQGLGRALVRHLEVAVARRGCLTLWLGTDDESGLTSLAGLDLFPGVLDKLRTVEDRKGHPLGFYRRLGFEIVGVIPDANGFGRPDIIMARRVGKRPSGLKGDARGEGLHEGGAMP